MYSFEVLFALVNSMSKSEKRYFHLVADLQDGEKSYLKLFNILDSHKAFDDNLKKEIDSRFKGSSSDAARKHLYRVITKSLRQFESENSIESRLNILIQDSQILFNKGIIPLSLEQLSRAKELALRHEKYLHFIMAAKQELQFLARTQFVGITEDAMVEKQEHIKQFLEYETSASQHSTLYEVLQLRYWNHGMIRSPREVMMLNDLILEEHQVLNNHKISSFETKALHLNFQSTYFLMTGNMESSLSAYRELVELYDKYLPLWINAPIRYINLIDSILYDLRIMDHYDEMPFYIDRLKQVSSTTEGLSLIIKYRIFEHELQALADQKQIELAIKMVTENQPVLEKETAQLTLQMRTQLQFAITRTWFIAKDYSRALKQINEILNLPTGSLHQPLYVLCRLMNLQINASTDNMDHLSYAIRSIERKLRATQKIYGVEKLVITFAKRMLARKSLKDVKTQLQTLKENPVERQLIKELNLEEWIIGIQAKHFL
jgi:hypothetical protein